MPLIGPSCWNSIWKMKPETAGTTIIGSRKYTITSPRPLKSLTQQHREDEAEHALDDGADDP